MFGFLKKKLKEAVDKFSKKAEDEAEVVEEVKETIEVSVPKPKDKEETAKKKEEKSEKEDIKEEKKKVKEEPDDAEKDLEQEKEEEKKLKANKEIKKTKQVEVPKEPIASVQEEPKAKDEPNVEKEKLQTEEITEEKAVIEEKESDKGTEVKNEEPIEEKKGFFAKIFKKKKIEEDKEVSEDELANDLHEDKKEEKEKEVTVEDSKKELDVKEKPKGIEEPITEDVVKPVEEETVIEEKKGFFQKLTETVTKVSLSQKKFDELFWELELVLLENNVALEVIEKIKLDLNADLVDSKISKKDMESQIIKSLKKSINGLFDVKPINLLKEIRKKKPYTIVFIGINGAGKTTNLAKVAHLLKKNNLELVIGACDTFRAAAIQQLEEHANNLGVKIIKHDYGSDPAAVAFDTIKHAQSQNKDVVLLDTAGRLHSNKNLMQELVKVIRIAKPDLKIFVGESIAGNDVVEQVKLFNESVGIDAIILSKADTDEKGGAAISVSYITGKPIIFLGNGQNYEDLIEFDKDKLMQQIGLD